ncbi:MAG: hypothetical protein DRJ39_03615 [Thermoprotei archaeon]|nr:MAG: hypothetical protein DRJ39_03615 [Thermoprotei archaeon]
MSEKVDRRTWLKIAAGTVAGLAVGGVAGYLGAPSKPVEKTVEKTITKTITSIRTPEKEKVTVTLNWWPGPESDAVTPIVKWWNENMAPENNIYVELVLFGRAEHFDKVANLLISKSPEPDIVFMSYTVGRVYEHLEPLDKWFGSPKYPYALDHYVPAALDSFRVNGTLYGIPTDMNTSILMYRTDIIPDPPKTLEEMVEVARKWTKKYNPDSPTEYGFAIQGKNIWFNSYFWIDLYVNQGGPPLTPGNEVEFAKSLDSDIAKRTLEIYVKILEDGLSPPDCVDYEYAETNQALASGKVAMALQWQCALGELRNKKNAPLVYDKIGGCLPPGRKLPDGTIYRKSEVHVHGPGINKYSKHKEAAFKFFAFLTTFRFARDYIMNGAFTGSQAILFNDKIRKIRTDIPDLAPVYMNTWPMTTHPDLIAIHDIITRNINSALTKLKSVDKALSDAKKELLELLKAT